MQKQKLLFEQSRLCSRGAAEMALMYISSSNGQSLSPSPVKPRLHVKQNYFEIVSKIISVFKKIISPVTSVRNVK